MFGIQSLKDMHEWATERFGATVAQGLSMLVLVAITSVCITLIAVAVSWVWPVIKATWSLLPGTPPVSFDWVELAPGVIAIVIVTLVAYRLYRQLKSLTSTVNIIREWLSEPLEQRLKTIETSAANVDWVDETHASVQEQLKSVRKRINALEDHTGIYDLVRIMTEQHVAAVRAQAAIPSPNNALQAIESQDEAKLLGEALGKLLLSTQPRKRGRKPSDFVPSAEPKKPDSDM